MRRTLPLLLLFSLVRAMPDDRAHELPPGSGPTTRAGRSTWSPPPGAIAPGQPVAAAAGLAVLQRGGNAIDAAVTAAAVLNVVEPQMTGIGGDMFAIVWSAKEHKLVGLNASGRSGRLMTRDELLRRGRTRVAEESAEAITVPGALSGWAALLARYGTITLAQALEPAIALADSGFPVSPTIAGGWATTAEKLRHDDGARATYLVDATRAPHPGEWFTNSDLARTFRLIAAQGPAVLYGGELGQRGVDRVRAVGGLLTIEGLRAQQPVWVEPISVPFRGVRVWELPPNGQGIAVLEMLRILEPYDLKALGHNSAAYLHLLIETKKLAFADLARWVGDPDQMVVTPTALLSDDFIRARRAQIDTARAPARVEPGAAAPRGASEGARRRVWGGGGRGQGARLPGGGRCGGPDSGEAHGRGAGLRDGAVGGGGGNPRRGGGGRGYAAGSDPRKDGMAAGH